MTSITQHEVELLNILRKKKELKSERLALEAKLKTLYAEINRVNDEMMLLLDTIAETEESNV